MLDSRLDATAMAGLLARGEAAPTDLVHDAIGRVEALDPAINAVIVPRFEQALAEAGEARGPFAGVPFLLKDMNVAKGVPHSCGIAGVKAAGYVGDVDAHFVTAMRAAGFVLLGVTNCAELGMRTTTEPLAWGPTRNPWRLDRSAGGSSGGAAAAVAAELTPVAHATDGGGSARIPAAACGVVGLKASRGRVSTGPWIRFADDLFGNVHEGLVTRTVRDLASMLDVVSGRRPGDSWCAPTPARPYAQEVGADPGALRVGVLAHDPSGAAAVDPEIRAALETVAEALAALGHEPREEHPAVLAQGGIPAEFAPCFPVVVAHELAAYGRRIGRPLTEDDVEPETWALAQGAARVSGGQLASGVDALRRRGAAVRAWWEEDGWDLLLTPTTAAMPPAIGEVARLTREGGAGELVAAATAFTVAFNVSGQPALSLPLGRSEDGVPIGIQLVAAYGREDLLIRVAAQLERALPWAGRRPALLEEVAA